MPESVKAAVLDSRQEFENLTEEDKKKFLGTLSAENGEAFLRLQDEYKQ